MPEKHTTHHSLLVRLRDTEDTEAWDRFFVYYQTFIFKLACRFGCSEELAQDVIDLVGLAEHADIELETGGAIVLCDRTRTSQLLQNLLDNAVKYSDKERPKIHVSCQDADEYWQVSVADDGPGIEERFQKQVFRIFHRIDPKDKREGSGVGLAIAKKIVDLHSGRIWIESPPGRGTTFHFTMPKATLQKSDTKAANP